MIKNIKVNTKETHELFDEGFSLKSISTTILKYSVSKFVVSVLGAFLGIYSIRLLGPSEFGKYNVVIQIASTISVFSLLGLDVTLERFIPESLELQSRRALFSKSLKITSFLLFISTAILFTINNYVKIFPEEIKELNLFFYSFCFFLMFYQLGIGMLRGIGNFKAIPKIDFFNDIPSKVSAIVLLLLVGRNFKWAFYGGFFFQIVVCMIIVYLLSPYIQSKTKTIEFGKIKTKFAFGVYINFLMATLVTATDILLLRYFMSSQEVGIFTAGIKFTGILSIMLLLPLQSPLLHYFSKMRNETDKTKLLNLSTKYLPIVIAMVSLILFSFAELLVKIIIGDRYLESINVLRISSFYLVPLSFLVIWGPYITSKNKPGLLGIYAAVGFVLNLILDLIFIPEWSYNGAAIASLLAKTILPIFYIHHLELDDSIIRGGILMILALVLAIFCSYITNLYLAPLFFLVFISLIKIINIREILRLINS